MIKIPLIKTSHCGAIKRMGIDSKYGVTLGRWRGHRLYRWRVAYLDGQERRYKGFVKRAGKGGAEEFAEIKRAEIMTHGVESAHITDAERRAIMTFREKARELREIGEEVSIEDVINEWVNRQKIEIKRMTIATMVDKYVTYLDTKPNRKTGELLSEAHKRTERNRLEPFREEFGDWPASSLTQGIIKDWLDGLRQVANRPKGKGAWGKAGERTTKGKPLAARTRNHFRTTLSGFFDYVVDEDAAQSNPVAKIKKLGVGESKIGILKIEEVESLLIACSDDLVPAIAIGLFAGLRRAEIIRAVWEDIDLDEGDYGEITVPYSAATKNRFTREVKVSANLRLWLKPYERVTGKIIHSEAVYRERLQRAVEEAGIEWPHNALRHSFASYHYGLHRNKSELRDQMGHDQRSKTLELYYRRKIKRKVSQRFWDITPAIREES